MQKGQLEREDWIRLGLLVLAYFVARPWILKLFKWFFTNKDLSEGEAIQKEWAERKAKVGPNAIRGTKSEPVDSTTIMNAEATASGSNTNQANVVVNRKSKIQSPNDQKSAEEKLLDWEDEGAEPPVIAGGSGEKADVVTWLNQWDQWVRWTRLWIDGNLLSQVAGRFIYTAMEDVSVILQTPFTRHGALNPCLTDFLGSAFFHYVYQLLHKSNGDGVPM